MAKRFVDTGIWDKVWFRKLTPKMKETWRFLIEKCNHAGILDLDIDSISFNVGEQVFIDEIKTLFGHRVEFIGEHKIYITNFIDFQYGELNPANRVHLSIIKLLQKEGLYKPLTSPLQGAKDKDMDKDMDQVKEKDKDISLKSAEKLSLDLVKLWNDNRGAFSKVESLTDKRKSHIKAQLKKDPDKEHWTEVLDLWKKSDFCTTTWKPTFDDWLNESKRIATLEGKYNNRTVTIGTAQFGGRTKWTPAIINYPSAESVIAEQETQRGEITEEATKKGLAEINKLFNRGRLGE